MNDRGGGQTIRALPDLIARIRHFDEFRHVLGALQHGESGDYRRRVGLILRAHLGHPRLRSPRHPRRRPAATQ